VRRVSWDTGPEHQLRCVVSVGGQRGAAVVALVLAVLVATGGAASGFLVANQILVPAEVRLPSTDGALSAYGLRVRRNEWLQRNQRTTVSVSKKHAADSPRVHLRYYPPRPGMDLEARFLANRGADPQAWFGRACEPDDRPGTPGAAAEAGPAEPAAPQLEFGPVERTELGYEVSYRKACPDDPDENRHGRLLMMAAPASDDGGAVMLDSDLEGLGEAGPPPEPVRTYLHDVAGRVRKLE
jgi:hypothetical protein